MGVRTENCLTFGSPKSIKSTISRYLSKIVEYYIDTLLEELGINNINSNNSAYIFQNITHLKQSLVVISDL